MNRIFVLVIAWCGACSVRPADDGPVDVDTDVPICDGEPRDGCDSGTDACEGEVTETTLPGQNDVTVVALCKTCDDSCSKAGDPCGRYGDGCDYSGTRGVCGACCNGATGELRCHPAN